MFVYESNTTPSREEVFESFAKCNPILLGYGWVEIAGVAQQPAKKFGLHYLGAYGILD